jgi:hypothetical protein
VESSSPAGRMRLPLFVAALLAVVLTVVDPVPQDASASPDCEAFANAPELVAGDVVTNGGVHCTSSVTGLFRVDVTLYKDGAEVGWEVNTCHGEQQCGVRVADADVEGAQEWCAMTVGALTGAGDEGTGSTPRTKMVCEKAAF